MVRGKHIFKGIDLKLKLLFFECEAVGVLVEEINRSQVFIFEFPCHDVVEDF